MVRTGDVVESGAGLMTVVFERPTACGDCNGCMNKQCASVQIQGDAKVGDRVEVAMPDKSILGASAIAYVVPLVLLIGGMLLGNALYGPLGILMNRDLFAGAVGGVLFIIGVLIVYGIDRVLRKKQDWQPHVVAVHPGNSIEAQG